MTSAFPSRIRHFIDNLKTDFPKFDAELNAFFDSIGFTEKFPPVISKGPFLRSHAVKDNVWGMIEFDESTRRLIDSPLVQRLRGIRQIGLSHLTYPTATHTRLAHTLGVFEATTRLLNEIQKTYEFQKNRSEETHLRASTINNNTIEILKRAAILHDVGHGPYSHVSVRLFSPNASGFTLGGIPLDALLRRFRFEYLGVRQPGSSRPSGNKQLSEVISVILICSERFRKFYDQAVPSVNLNEEHDLFNISTLILGDCLTDDDLATPAIISSAIDADKIDYMIRDAKACGVSLSIDPSRTFHGAGVYTLPVRDDPYFGERNLNNTDLVSVFVIDKAGSDTYLQVGFSRLSLYSRVYHHPLTRNAEFRFVDLMSELQTDEPELRDVLKVWKMSEGEIFHRAQNSVNKKISQMAHSFIWRSFPKRAANLELGSLTFCFSTSHTAIFEPNFATLVTDVLYPAFERPDFIEDIASRIFTLGPLVGINKSKLGADSLNLRFIPPPTSEEAIIGNTRLIDRASQRLVKCEFHVPSYLQAGAIAEKRSYVVVREDLREIAAVATALEIFKRGVDRDLIEPTLVKELPSNTFWPKGVRFLPILDMVKVSNTCKISQANIGEILSKLEEKYPTDPAPRLLNRPKPSTLITSLVDKFGKFEGAKGWKITQAHLMAFLAQFPTRLRDDLLSLVEKIQVFDRQKICTDIQKAINKITKKDASAMAFVVPFTMNSGHVALSYLRDSIHFPDANWTLKDSLRSALAVCRPKDWIIFVDDHAASGTQVRRRLTQWVRGGNYQGGDTQLELIYLRQFQEARIGFAFAAMAEKGIDEIGKLGSELNLDIAEIVYGIPFQEYSLKSFVNERPELREFLQLVGTGLMLPAFASPKTALKKRVSQARDFSLGYQNAEGGLITELNVPTSTYTALWRPGFFDPSGKYQRSGECMFPWMPLFIRSSHIDQITLF